MTTYNPSQMKICLYCGRTNAMSVDLCAGCGASRFELAPLPTQPQQIVPPMPPVRVQQIHPAIMVIYFFFFGFFAAFFWLLLSLSVAVTLIGLPLAASMLGITPTVATLYRNPQRSPGDALRSGWNTTLLRYRAAPILGKILAPVVFALCMAVLLFWIYGRK